VIPSEFISKIRNVFNLKIHLLDEISCLPKQIIKNVNQKKNCEDSIRSERKIALKKRLVLDVGTKTGRGTEAFTKNYLKDVGLTKSDPIFFIGIDLIEDRLIHAAKNKIFAIKADACILPFKEDIFDVAVLMEIIEHLSEDLALKALLEVEKVTQRNIFIQNPDFSSEGYLRNKGLQFAWMNCKVHPHHITYKGLDRLLTQAGFCGYTIKQIMPVNNSNHPLIVPIDAEKDTQKFDPKIHKKPFIKFHEPVFEKLQVTIDLLKHSHR
jgi:SAM-dependent methyltransferase